MNEKIRSRNGLIYTTFALLSSALLLFMVTLPATTSVEIEPSQSIRIGEASFFLDTVLDDMDRSLEIATRRSLSASTNYVISTEEPLVNPRENVTSALVNGTISGDSLASMESASLTNWTSRVSSIASESNYDLRAQFEDYTFDMDNFTVESSYTVFVRLKDPVTLSSFNRTNTANTSVSVEGIEDPMLLLQSKGRYVSKYSRCGFSDPADQLYSGTYYSNGAVVGEAVVKPSDASSVESPGEKILVADNIDNYPDSDVNDFEGAVAADNNSVATYTNKYVLDTPDISDIDGNMSLILHQDQVWRSNLFEMIDENCYLNSDRGPDFMDRLANRLVNSDGKGIATMVDVSELPSDLQKEESAVGFVYFNSSSTYGSTNKIRGITGERSWFRLDQHHVDEWGMNDLAY